MQKWKQVAGLTTLLVGLGALATWDEWKTKNEEKEKETKGVLLSITPDSVTGLRLKTTNDDSGGEKTPGAAPDLSKLTEITLRLNGSSWDIISPVTTTADQQVVADLIKNVTDYKTESEVSKSKEQWPQFGLANPRREIEIETKDNKKVKFFVGLNTPVGFSVYTATSNADTVYTGSQYIATSTAKTLFDLRDKKVLSGSPSDITAVKLTTKSGAKLESLNLVQNDGKWTIQGPSTTPGDNVSIKNYLEDVFGIKAEEFFDHPSKELLSSLSDKNLLAKLELSKKDTPISLTVSQVKDAFYAQVSGITAVFKVPTDARSKILKTAKDLRDKKIFSFGSSDVTKVTIDGESFAKVATDWYRAEDAGNFSPDGKFSGKAEEKPATANHIRGLVVDLEYARAEDVFDSSSAVAKNLPKAPKHRVILGLSPKEKDITIDVWTAQDNPEMIYIRRSDAPQIYKSKRSTIASLSPNKMTPVGDEASGGNPAGGAPPDLMK